MPIEPITPQAAFDAALFGIRGQGYKRSETYGACKYRGDNGLKCGIGHILPDDLCVSDDGLSLDSVSDTGIGAILDDYECDKVKAFFANCKRSLLCEMQHAHDRSLDVGAWRFEKAMQRIASDFDLTYTPPKEGTV